MPSFAEVLSVFIGCFLCSFLSREFFSSFSSLFSSSSIKCSFNLVFKVRTIFCRYVLNWCVIAINLLSYMCCSVWLCVVTFQIQIQTSREGVFLAGVNLKKIINTFTFFSSSLYYNLSPIFCCCKTWRLATQLFPS